MSGDWKSLLTDAANWIALAVTSYIATMKELFDNTLEVIQLQHIKGRTWCCYIVSGVMRLINLLGDDILTSSFTFWQLFSLFVFGLLGLAIAFYLIYLTLKFVLWICFGCKRTLDCKLNMNGQENGARFKKDCHTPPESHQWLRQAMNDLESARNDFDGDRPAPEWVCYKCHQAMRKLLKAYVIYHNIPVTATSLSLTDFAGLTGDGQLKNAACQLHRAVGSTLKMQYPSSTHPAAVPRDVYSLQVALTVHEITEKTLEYTCHLLYYPL